MKAEKQRRTVEFIEQDEDFIKQISKDIGCYYSKANKLTFNLCTFKTTIPSKMRVFAWVHKEEKDDFWVATRKLWLDEVRNISSKTHFPPNTQDGDSVSFGTRDRYQDTVRVLKLINAKN